MLRRLGCSICLLASALGAGCSSGGKNSHTAEPGFVIPAAGEKSDTVLRVGDPFPKIEGVDLDGQPVVLDESQRGERYTLIVFWSTWCGFCMRELPHEIELAREYEPLGLRVIGVNGDKNPKVARAAAAKLEIPWMNLFEGPNHPISKKLEVEHWPVLILLDHRGRVVSTSTHLRSISVETLADGTDRQVDGLEWTLRKLMKEGKKEKQAIAAGSERGQKRK